ncbi:MAG: aminoglycoside phosphotransferase family protein [Acidobacteriota bacterium]
MSGGLRGSPPAELEIDAALVRALLREQHPDLAKLPLEQVGAGWDNQMFRLGDDLAVRLPRRRVAVELLEREQRWLPVLARSLPLRVPAPVRIGRGGTAFPWPWTVQPWIAGRTANRSVPPASEGAAWGRFLRTLHRPAPAEAPRNPLRGVPLQDRAAKVGATLERLARGVDPVDRRIQELWRRALEAPVARSHDWLHGDLHGRNVLVESNRIVAVIDWGDVTAGDGATDLASVWTLFDAPEGRRRCLEAYGPPPSLLARAKGWAVLFGSFLLETGRVDHPEHRAMGEAILRRLVEDG